MKSYALLATATMLIVVPDQLGAQSCGFLRTGCSSEAHTMPQSPESMDFDEPHEDCRICPGTIWNCHFSCGGNDLAGIALSARLDLLRAVDRGDAEVVMSLSHLAQARLNYNRARDAIQLVSCSGGDIVASLPLRGAPRLVALAERISSNRETLIVADLRSHALTSPR